jgi:hypothetical protein
MGYAVPRCSAPPLFNERFTVNAPYRAAKELADLCARGGLVHEILPVLGWPDAVEGTDSEWVVLVWQHPTYGELRYRGWLGEDRRDSGSRIPWRARREYARPWLMTWTGEIRVRQSYGPPVVHAERRLHAWPEVTIWCAVGSHSGVYSICPPELADTVRGLLSTGAKPLSEYQQDYAARLAAWTPWLYTWRRALWLADEDGSHSRVVRLQTSVAGTTPSYESDDGGERGGVECVYYTVADIGVTGYLQAAGASVFGNWSTKPRGPDVPKEIFPDTREYQYGWHPYQDTAIPLRSDTRCDRVPDVSAWPAYPRHPQGTYGDTELYGHPLASARAAALAETIALPHLPGVEQEVAYTATELAAHREALVELRSARLAKLEEEVQALVPAIRDIYAADQEWVVARAALVAARDQAETLIRQVRGITMPEEIMRPTPERALAFDAVTLRAEAEAMSTRAAALRKCAEQAVAAHRLPVRQSTSVTHQPEGAPAAWTCNGIDAAEVTARLGVPEGIGVSGAVLADGRAERGTYPVVAIVRPFAGGKRWSRTVVEMHGLRPLVDECQGTTSGARSSYAQAVMLVCAVTDPAWSVTIETTRDGNTMDTEVIRAPIGPAVVSTPATLADLRARYRRP